MIQVQVGHLADLLPGHLAEERMYKAIVGQVILGVAVEQVDELITFVVEMNVRISHQHFRNGGAVLSELRRLQDFF